MNPPSSFSSGFSEVGVPLSLGGLPTETGTQRYLFGVHDYLQTMRASNTGKEERSRRTRRGKMGPGEVKRVYRLGAPSSRSCSTVSRDISGASPSVGGCPSEIGREGATDPGETSEGRGWRSRQGVGGARRVPAPCVEGRGPRPEAPAPVAPSERRR